jgi:Tfp pilus assembly pilus retraction ATPase PilT
MDLNATLLRAAELGASDVHFKVAKPPMLRVDGDIQALDDTAALSETDLRGHPRGGHGSSP